MYLLTGAVRLAMGALRSGRCCRAAAFVVTTITSPSRFERHTVSQTWGQDGGASIYSETTVPPYGSCPPRHGSTLAALTVATSTSLSRFGRHTVPQTWRQGGASTDSETTVPPRTASLGVPGPCVIVQMLGIAGCRSNRANA